MEDDEEVKKKKKMTPPGLKFFISNCNTYFGETLLQQLRNDHLHTDPFFIHSFRGTECIFSL
jgi:hypothetical protein